MTHIIFGINEPHPKDKVNLNLNPPSTYARRHPLYIHPLEAITKPIRRTWNFSAYCQCSDEPDILAKNEKHSPTRTNSSTIGGGGLEWGAWFEFTDKDDRITNPSLAFLVDIFLSTPTLLPESEKVGLPIRLFCFVSFHNDIPITYGFISWHSTMTLSVEFKNKIPPPSFLHADRTVGLYSCGRFMTAPQGRHDAYVEVWTAPSNIGEGSVVDNWRDNQICLATATQMVLTLPMQVNEKLGKAKL